MNILTHHSSALGGAVVFRAVKESDEKLYIEISVKMIKEGLVLPMDWFVSIGLESPDELAKDFVSAWKSAEY